MSRSDPADPVEIRAADGRLPGRRGRATRERLLQCTADLLEKTSFRDLTVIDIARCAGTSPATFYQYFADVEAAVLVLAGIMADEGKQLTALIRSSDWRGRSGYTAAEGLVDGILGLWERHRAVLRVVDLSTAEGDLRFQNIRTHLLNEVTSELRDVIQAFKAQDRHGPEVDAMAQAAALVSMLVHVAAHRYGYEFWGIRTEDMRRSVAGLVYTGVTGRRPTSG
ncbi:MAG TPA: TetR family transcriptional regulator [Actinomycetota bacterium]|nr:TetR family transcriptional regulator [Actinomycetota bacterium]